MTKLRSASTDGIVAVEGVFEIFLFGFLQLGVDDLVDDVDPFDFAGRQLA